MYIYKIGTNQSYKYISTICSIGSKILFWANELLIQTCDGLVVKKVREKAKGYIYQLSRPHFTYSPNIQEQNTLLFFKWNDSFIYTLVHLILNGCEEKKDLKARLAIVRCGFVFCLGVEPTNTRKLANSFVTFGVNQANLPVMQISLKPSSLMIVL